MMTTASSIAQREQALPIPLGFVPEGLQETMFDENTLYVLKHALPAQYRQIFLHLLLYGTTHPRSAMQHHLFEAVGEGNHEAIILYRSVALLAKSPQSPASPETYHKGLLLCEALKILRRVFHKGYTEIRIPLGKREIQIPALLQSLRQLHESYHNPKVQQLARKVAKTLQSGDFLAGIPRQAEHVAPNLRTLLTRLLREHGITEGNIQHTTLSQTCEVITQVLAAMPHGRVLPGTGDSAKMRAREVWRNGGESLLQTGDSCVPEDAMTQTEPVSTPPQNGEFLEMESPTLSCSGRKGHGHHLQKGDSDAVFGKESPTLAKNLLLSAKVGDSEADVSIIDIPITHSITEKEKTIIDTTAEMPPYVDSRPYREILKEAVAYQNRFDKGGGRQWLASLYNAVRFTPPAVRHLAAIATHYYMMFRLPDGKMVKRPGGVFTRTCELYRQPDADIPQDIQAWAETGLSLSEIEIKLKEGMRHPASLHAHPLDRAGLPRGITLQKDEAGTERYVLPVTVCPDAYGWMDQGQAQELAARIEHEKRGYPIQAEVLPGAEKGVFVVMTTWDGAEVIHHTAEQWTAYFTDVKSCLEM